MATIAPSIGPDLTLGAYLADWLAHMRGRVRPKTHEGYAGLGRLYAVPALGARPLTALGALDLQSLHSELLDPSRGLSGGTVLNLHLVLTQALGQARRWGLTDSNPAEGAQPPRSHRPEPALVDEALAARLLECHIRHPLRACGGPRAVDLGFSE